MASNSKKRKLIESNNTNTHSTSKRFKTNNHHNTTHFVPINQREQLTRKQISEKLHFESFNDENTKTDQLSLLNKKEKYNNIDNKIENLCKYKNYSKNGKGMINMLNDLCDMENNDSDYDEQYQRQQKKKQKEKERIFKLKKQCKNYKGNIKNIELTINIKQLTLDTRQRAISKLFQIIKENHKNDIKTSQNEQLLMQMSVECELNMCKKSNSSIMYGQYIRNEIQNIRSMTKKNILYNIDIKDDQSESESESDSESASEDDDIPIGSRIKRQTNEKIHAISKQKLDEKKSMENDPKKCEKLSKDCKITLSLDSELGELLRSLPMEGVIEYKKENTFWMIKLDKEWQNNKLEFALLSDKLYCNEIWYKEGVIRGKEWGNMVNEKDIDIKTMAPTSIAGLHITLGRVDINDKNKWKCLVEERIVKFKIKRLICYPPFRIKPANLSGQEMDGNGYRYYATCWIALEIEFVGFEYETNFTPHISLCNIGVKLKVDDVENLNNSQ